MIGRAEAADPLPAKIQLEGVSKSFRTSRSTVSALEQVDLSIEDGQFVCLLGPSGCGKSTILNLIAGLERPDAGRVLCEGVPVTGPGRDRMVLFQESALFPWLTAQGNVELALKLGGFEKAERKERVKELLALVNLTEFATRRPHELSGGMRQRVALARALAQRSELLLMDEPFAALDALTREQLYGDLQRIWEERKKTIVFVTHNVREAACLGDRVVLLSPHPGRVREEFAIDLPRPRDINSVELARYATKIRGALRTHLDSDSRSTAEVRS